jgi:hypothetical protein
MKRAHIWVRVTLEQKREIERRARLSGQTVSVYVRDRVLRDDFGDMSVYDDVEEEGPNDETPDP